MHLSIMNFYNGNIQVHEQLEILDKDIWNNDNKKMISIKVHGQVLYKGAWDSLRLDKSPWIVLDFG